MAGGSVEARDLPGCFVDGETLDQATADIQEVIAMFIESSIQEGQPLPRGIVRSESLPIKAAITVAPGEYDVRKMPDDLRDRRALA